MRLRYNKQNEIIKSALANLKSCRDLIHAKIKTPTDEHWMLLQSTDESIKEMGDYLENSNSRAIRSFRQIGAD